MKIPFLIACCLLVGSQLIFGQKSNQAQQFKKVEALLHRHYKPSSPGVAVAIIAKGKTVYTGQLGQADLEHGVRITDSTAFHIASVSKQFTAYLALLLEKEGRLSLDDDVRQHLPELQRLPYRISLRQLANHTHGLPNLFELARLRGIGIADHMTHREVVELLLQIRQVNFEPGARYEYNNTGYVLLAEVLERVSGKPFQELLRERIFTPLGMRHSRAVPNSAMLIKNKAKSYRFNDGAYENNPLHLMANGSSGISTTLDDLRKWAVHFQEPSAQAQEILRQMQETTRLNTGNVIPYGLGLECKKYKGLEVVFHGGGDAGYRSYLLHVPRHQLSVVILGNNNDFTPLTLVYEIVDLLLKEHLQEPVVPGKLHYTTGELKAFEGTYEMFPGTYYNIIAENDTLYFQAYGYHNYTFGSGSKHDTLYNDPLIYLSNYAGAGAIYSTAEDLHKLVQALRTNKLLSANTTSTYLLRPQQATFIDYARGYPTIGFFLNDKAFTRPVLERRGSINGFNSLLLMDTNMKKVLIILTNTDTGDLEEMGDKVYKELELAQPDKPIMH